MNGGGRAQRDLRKAALAAARSESPAARGEIGMRARMIGLRSGMRGAGPALVLFHQSPLSSRDLVATIERWQPYFTCIAPDTPGYGLSDPIGAGPLEMSEIARASIEVLDALGIDKAAVYGFHTGAMIAAAVAEAYPGRVSCAVSNGFVVMDEPERADILANYLPPFVPSWDGAHLAWLWSRLREQTIFFPWYSKRSEDRLDYDLPAPAALQGALLDFLRAGDRYRHAYRAAFAMRSQETLARMRSPLLVTASSTDDGTGSRERARHHCSALARA
ncbi:MAG: alpha/beta fold hydrolase [Phycisphaerae bacterium]|nr:alpha/beta fold hydrolase [Phycisphaerae bacterium]